MDAWEEIEHCSGRAFGVEIVLSVFMATLMGDDPEGERTAQALFENCWRLGRELPDEPAADAARDAIGAIENLTRAALNRVRQEKSP